MQVDELRCASANCCASAALRSVRGRHPSPAAVSNAPMHGKHCARESAGRLTATHITQGRHSEEQQKRHSERGGQGEVTAPCALPHSIAGVMGSLTVCCTPLRDECSVHPRASNLLAAAPCFYPFANTNSETGGTASTQNTQLSRSQQPTIESKNAMLIQREQARRI